ncbi:hypothetical protein VDGL01_01207 [Verticillium dahliae]
MLIAWCEIARTTLPQFIRIYEMRCFLALESGKDKFCRAQISRSFALSCTMLRSGLRTTATDQRLFSLAVEGFKKVHQALSGTESSCVDVVCVLRNTNRPA